MKIHKEGYGILLRLLLLLALANILLIVFLPAGHTAVSVSQLLSGAFYLFVLWFFRVPSRSFNPDENLIVAPADGKIVAVEETDENEYFGDKRLQVSIFMSPLNVHVNHFPIGGQVRYFKYHPGDYMVAWHPKASAKNERTAVVIENGENSSVLVRQIAGAVARRIICYARPEEQVQQGQELGFIKFGSRVDLFLPLDVKLLVKPGQKVSGKKTIIANFR